MCPPRAHWEDRFSCDSNLLFSDLKTCPLPSCYLLAGVCRFIRRNIPFSVKSQMISKGILNEEGLWDHLVPGPYFRIPGLIYVQLGKGHSADWHKVQRENPGPLPSGAIYILCVITPVMLLKSAENSKFVFSETGVKHRTSHPPCSVPSVPIVHSLSPSFSLFPGSLCYTYTGVTSHSYLRTSNNYKYKNMCLIIMMFMY